MTRLKITVYVAFMAGLALALALLSYWGFGPVTSLLLGTGWGLVWVALYHVGPIIIYTFGWQALLESRRPPFARLVYFRWIGEAANSLLPLAQIGGELIRGRLLAQTGVPPATAAASVVADHTAGFFMELVFALVGAGLLLGRSEGGRYWPAILGGLAFMGLLFAGFYLLQRYGLFRRLAKVVVRVSGGRDWLSLVGGAEALDEALERMYSRRAAFLVCCGWRLLGWFLGTGEIWLGLYFLGHPVDLGDALILESMGQVARSAAFLIPGALGVQEGGYVLIGSMLGLDQSVCLALSLVKRARDLILGIPGLVAWQATESYRFWRRRRATSQSSGAIQ